MKNVNTNQGDIMEANIPRRGVLDMQVCVPKDWTDEQVLAFAEKENPCGTKGGWSIRRQGSEFLSGSDERVQSNNVHIMLDA
jgi:hypothetical protein